LTVVALVAVGAVGVADIGLDTALAAAEPVFAAGILAVHQTEQFVLDLLELGGDGFAVMVVVGAVAGMSGQVSCALGHSEHRLQDALFLGEGVGGVHHVGLVLAQQIGLLFQLQQA